MCKGTCQRLGWALAVIAAWGTCTAAWAHRRSSRRLPVKPPAQYAAPAQSRRHRRSGDALTFDDIRARFEQQQRQIADLQEQLRRAQQRPQVTPVADYPAQGEAAAEASGGQEDRRGLQVGSDLSIKASFKDGLFLWLETPNKDFTMHLERLDAVGQRLVGPVAGLEGRQRRATPVRHRAWLPATRSGGIGNLQDGIYFRRIRPFVEGTFWENGEYRLIPALENNQFNTAGLDEIWVGATEASPGRDRPHRTRQEPDGPGRRYDRLQPLHDLHGTIGLLRSHRIEPELRHRLWFGDTLLRPAHDVVSSRSFVPIRALHRRFLRRRPVGRAGPSDRPCPCMKMKAGTCCTWASRADGATDTQQHRQRAFALNTIQLRARPEMRDDVPGGGVTRTPTATGWSTPA